MKPKQILRVLSTSAALAVATAPAMESSAFAWPPPQKTSNPDNRKKQEKNKAAQEGREKAKARQELTGRDHQGNHDSLTKSGIRGGAKGDRHDKGTTQNGKAGSSSSGKKK